MIQKLYDIFCQSKGVTTDTRKCGQGTMFFALKGASFNGNQFAQQALEAGCICAVVDEEQYATDSRCILVDNALAALQQMAAMHRRRMGEGGLQVIQITGTNGKTTTKELCAAVLSKAHNVLYTQGNLNNHIGVPLTLLRIRPEHDIAVVETGANHPGEIRDLTAIVQPDCGLITNVGRAHLEGFGGFDGVKRTKGELYDYLAAHGRFAFVNPLDEHLCGMAAERNLHTEPYIDGFTMGGTAFMAFCCGDKDIQTNLVGAYNLPNALAAITVGMHFGVSLEQAAQAIHDYVPSNNRSQLVETGRNTLIVDAYNANPSSMALAIDNFRQIVAPHKMMILGEMRELGESSADEHGRVARMAIQSGVEAIWFVGRAFAPFATNGTCLFDDVEAVTKTLQSNPLHGRTILIKGSNGTRQFQLPLVL